MARLSECLLSPSNRDYVWTLQPLHEKPSTAQAVVSTVTATAAGTTTLLVVAPRTCRHPRALLRGRASKSEANSSASRDCTSRSARRVVPLVHKKRDVIGFPAFAFARMACNLLPPRVTTSSTFLYFLLGRFYYVLFRDILKLVAPDSFDVKIRCNPVATVSLFSQM